MVPSQTRLRAPVQRRARRVRLVNTAQMLQKRAESVSRAQSQTHWLKTAALRAVSVSPDNSAVHQRFHALSVQRVTAVGEAALCRVTHAHLGPFRKGLLGQHRANSARLASTTRCPCQIAQPAMLAPSPTRLRSLVGHCAGRVLPGSTAQFPRRDVLPARVDM
jgi:hypothetical protein